MYVYIYVHIHIYVVSSLSLGGLRSINKLDEVKRV